MEGFPFESSSPRLGSGNRVRFGPDVRSDHRLCTSWTRRWDRHVHNHAGDRSETECIVALLEQSGFSHTRSLTREFGVRRFRYKGIVVLAEKE